MSNTKQKVLKLAQLYKSEASAKKQMEEAKKNYDFKEEIYLALRDQVDVAELEIEGMQGEIRSNKETGE